MSALLPQPQGFEVAANRVLTGLPNPLEIARVRTAVTYRVVDAITEAVRQEDVVHGFLAALSIGERVVLDGRHPVAREFLLDVWEVIADTEFEFPEIRDVGDQVVGLGHFRGRGKGSGVETETPFAYVAEFRGGKAIRVRAYLDPKEALEAAGLRE